MCAREWISIIIFLFHNHRALFVRSAVNSHETRPDTIFDYNKYTCTSCTYCSNNTQRNGGGSAEEETRALLYQSFRFPAHNRALIRRLLILCSNVRFTTLRITLSARCAHVEYRKLSVDHGGHSSTFLPRRFDRVARSICFPLSARVLTRYYDLHIVPRTGASLRASPARTVIDRAKNISLFFLEKKKKKKPIDRHKR